MYAVIFAIASIAVASAFWHGSGPALVIPPANNVSANWARAGLATVGGIPTRNTQCGATVAATGLTPPAANDDAVRLMFSTAQRLGHWFAAGSAAEMLKRLQIEM